LQISILLVLCIPSAKQCEKKIAKPKAAVTEHNNVVDHKRNDNAVAGIRRLTFPVINKSVSAKAKEVKIQVAACVWWHCSTATVHHPSVTIKRH